MFQGLQPVIDLPTLNLAHIPKIALLIVIILYAIFSFMVFIKVRALERIVIFPGKSIITSVPKIALYYCLLVISLFFLTLVIV